MGCRLRSCKPAPAGREPEPRGGADRPRGAPAASWTEHSVRAVWHRDVSAHTELALGKWASCRGPWDLARMDAGDEAGISCVSRQRRKRHSLLSAGLLGPPTSVTRGADAFHLFIQQTPRGAVSGMGVLGSRTGGTPTTAGGHESILGPAGGGRTRRHGKGRWCRVAWWGAGA